MLLEMNKPLPSVSPVTPPSLAAVSLRCLVSEVQVSGLNLRSPSDVPASQTSLPSDSECGIVPKCPHVLAPNACVVTTNIDDHHHVHKLLLLVFHLHDLFVMTAAVYANLPVSLKLNI